MLAQVWLVLGPEFWNPRGIWFTFRFGLQVPIFRMPEICINLSIFLCKYTLKSTPNQKIWVPDLFQPERTWLKLSCTRVENLQLGSWLVLACFGCNLVGVWVYLFTCHMLQLGLKVKPISYLTPQVAPLIRIYWIVAQINGLNSGQVCYLNSDYRFKFFWISIMRNYSALMHQAVFVSWCVNLYRWNPWLVIHSIEWLAARWICLDNIQHGISKPSNIAKSCILS